MVTKACKYPEIAVRFADYFYSVEGSYTALYGPPGEDKIWYVGEDKLVHFTESEDGRSIEERAYEYTPGLPDAPLPRQATSWRQNTRKPMRAR